MRTISPLAIPFSISAVATFAGASMPWGEVTFARATGFDGPVFGNPTIEVNAWSSTVTALVVKIPNWSPFLVAVCLAIWAIASGRKSGWVWLAIVYGLLHCAGTAYFFYDFGETRTFGFGIVVTFLAFLAMCISYGKYKEPVDG